MAEPIVNPRGRPPRQIEWGSNATPSSSSRAGSAGSVEIRWDNHLQSTTPLLSPESSSYGAVPGGRFVVRVWPGADMRAFRYWLADPTGGFQDLLADEDAYTQASPRDIVFSGTGVYEFYVSSFDFEGRDLYLQPFGNPVFSGAPLSTNVYQLRVEGEVEAHVEHRSPEGHSSDRWRHVDFGVSPSDFRNDWDAVWRIVNDTEFEPSGVQYRSGKFALGFGQDAWLYRPWRNDIGNESSLRWHGMGQFRRIVQVNNTNGDIDNPTSIAYDRPFDPPLQTDDLFYVVTSCVMARVMAAGATGSDYADTLFRPTFGNMYLDMWGLYNNLYRDSSGGITEPMWGDKFVVEYYFHNPGWTQGFGNLPDDDTIIPVIFPRPRVKRLSLRADYPPRFRKVRVTESAEQDETNVILRVEPEYPHGRVDRWRLYLRHGAWPTLDDTTSGFLDPDYLVGDYPRSQPNAVVELGDTFDNDWRVIVVPFSATGDEGSRYVKTWDAAPSAPALLDGLRVDADDAAWDGGFNDPSNNVVRWSANNDAQAPDVSMTIDVWREDWEGMAYNERRTVRLAGPSTSLAELGEFTHAYNTPGAKIQNRVRPPLLVTGDAIEGPSSYMDRRLTWCYALTLWQGGAEISKQIVKRSDWFYDSPTIELKNLYARGFSTGKYNAVGEQYEPYTMLITLEADNMDRFEGSSNACVITLEYRVAGSGAGWGVVREIFQPISMGFEYYHEIWGPIAGSTAYEYRASWRFASFPGDRNDPITTISNVIVPTQPPVVGSGGGTGGVIGGGGTGGTGGGGTGTGGTSGGGSAGGGTAIGSALPNVIGFGTNTVAGRGGTIMRVTNLNDAGAGSLRAALTATGPRVVVFETSGTIELASKIAVTNPFLTIAGQTAPSPGILLKNHGISIRTNDVLVQHLRIRVGGYTGADTNEDCIEVLGPAFNVVIDHDSLSWSTDENGSTWYTGTNTGARDVTVANSIIAENQGSGGFLIGQYTDRFMLYGSLLINNDDRNPYFKGRSNGVVANNLIYNWGQNPGCYMADPDGLGPNMAAWVGNVFKLGPNTTNVAMQFYATCAAGSLLYVADNSKSNVNGGLPPSDPWSIVNNAFGVAGKATTPPVWPVGFTAAPNASVATPILSSAGAWASARDSVDTRLVAEVLAGTGQLLQSETYPGGVTLASVGGFPSIAVNVRTMETAGMPSDPWGDSDGDGVPNMEEWLRSMADVAAGTSSGVPPLAGGKPSYLGTSIDQKTGKTITRITGDPGTAIPVVSGRTWGTIAYHNYPKDQPFNADESLIILKQLAGAIPSGGFLFLNASDYSVAFERPGGTTPVAGPGECRWHPTNASQMIVLNDDGGVKWWNPVANTAATKVAAVGGYTNNEMGPSEGNATYDGSRVVAKAVRTSDSHIVARVINIDAGTVGVVIDITAAGLTNNPAGSPDLDWVSISPLGNYVVAEGNFGLGRSDTRKVWDASTGALVRTISNYLGQHIDLGVDASGNEVIFSVTGESPYSHGAFMQRLSDGVATALSPTNISSFNWHVSTRPNIRTGVLSVNDSQGFTYDGMLVGVHLGTPNVVTPYCVHHSNNTDYDSAPKACMSPLGTRVIFASNWSTTANRPMQTYVVDL